MTIKKPTLDLRQFMLRQNVLRLYKDIMKTIREIPNEQDRTYMLEWARKDFKSNKSETDEYVIKSHMKTGEAILNELKLSLKMSS
ncbi:LYR motif-containing protein 2 [Planococcus citri]|uniref:LYR motif-containing protein 2 n=1 Tax=Planococcus citri TaxID=170843 RepID=UPI0031F7D273